MTSTTGTTIESYIDWMKKELEKKNYGEVSLTFIICRGQVTDVKKISMDNDHYKLEAK
jgi:hypothetical protein